ncbi:hypothetical protein PFISCL1PPCAC_1926 [Pristionchus fissidentatus]|uniref:Uncharacterized protein n=1 Tax=Pristionchus fissidentatus TaxID=1538716 RepID=A0AAV5UY29_9BILA|nr:hypothetical protein PFISCL1PPCAC_1926 [Pristionchus fissidentatus]
MVTGRTLKEWGVFGALIVTMHWAYYKIQANPSLVQPHERQELFYMRWIKNAVPALKDFGVQEDPSKHAKHE